MSALDLSVNHPVGDFVREVLFPNSPDLAWAANGLIAAVALVLFPVFLSAPFLIWMERKVCAHMQARLGPMRHGPHGAFQTIADVMKLLFKEIALPGKIDRLPYLLAPAIPLTASFLSLAVIPWDHDLQVADPEQGILYLLAVGALGILGILVGAWASNSKFALLGAMRAGAQMLSYEVSLGVLMLLVALLSGESSLREIVLSQQGTVADWWIHKAPVVGFLAFVLYLVSSTAELNRGPFDLVEAEQELTAGYQTEYSGMGFAMFYLAEYVNLVIQAALVSTFFLGGFLPPQFGIAPVDGVLAAVPGIVWMVAKILLVIFVYMWFRWSFPRPRIDQLLALEWKILVPANLVLFALGVLLVSQGWIL